MANRKKQRQGDGRQDGPAGHVSRRSFLSSLGAAGVVATAGPVVAAAKTASPVAPMTPADVTAAETIEGAIPVSLRVNGKQLDLRVDPRTTLLDCLRETISLTGTKKGCDHGQCGACTVHVNGRRINSCLTLAVMHEGDQITTVEGLARDGQLSPLQDAFIRHDAFQCGFCTAGQLCSAAACLNEGHANNEGEVREWMSGNLCRCGAYPNIVAAILELRQQTPVAGESGSGHDK